MAQEGAITITGEDGISYARLAAMKGRIKMEAAGLKFRGGSTRTHVAAELGLKPRDKHEKFIAEIQKRMNELLAKKDAAAKQAQSTPQ